MTLRPLPLRSLSTQALKSLRCYGTATQSRPDPLRLLSTPAVARGALVYSALSLPGFTEASPHLLRLANSIPGVKQLSHAFIRETFFKHFVGGDHLDDTIPLIQDLRRQGLGTLLGYSVEMESEGAGAKPTLEQMQRMAAKNVTEVLRSTDVASQIEDRSGRSKSHERKTWIAVKLVSIYMLLMTLVPLIIIVVRTPSRSMGPSEGLPEAIRAPRTPWWCL
jgi:hypothetical protein